MCGDTITEYEHFFPDFVDADEHNPERIVLLCPTHHSLVTKGIIPKTKVKKAWESPAAKSVGFSKLNHPWFEGIPSLKLGGGPIVHGTPIPIQVKGENIIEFSPPEQDSNICRISANLRDSAGDNILKIVENEWRVLAGSWDFKSVANRYIFYDSSRQPSLVLRMEAPHHIAIELLKTSANGMPIHITENNMMIGTSMLSGGLFSNCHVGISIG